MDSNRTRVPLSPGFDSGTEGPPTSRASRSEGAKTISIAETLALLNKREHMSLYGCKLCGPAANCTCIAARGYDNETALACQDLIREDDTEHFADRNPQTVLDKMNRQEDKIEFQKLAPDNASSPFCCKKLVHIEHEGSGEFLEEGRRDPILKFIKNIETAQFRSAIEMYSNEELKAVKELYRVKRIGDDTNKATWIFVPVQNNGEEAHAAIFKIDPPHAFERFGGPKTGGRNGFLAFNCPVHKCKYQVGYSIYHMIGKNGTVATFEDGRLDALMKVARLERLQLGYGSPGW